MPQTMSMTDDTPKPRPASDSIYPALPLEELVSALARSSLFRDVEPAQLRLLAFSAEVKDVPAGTVLQDAPDGKNEHTIAGD